jgi:transcription elongation factor Elf1
MARHTLKRKVQKKKKVKRNQKGKGFEVLSTNDKKVVSAFLEAFIKKK